MHKGRNRTILSIKVIYEESGVDYLLLPVWMIIDHSIFDWDKTFYIDITTPFERLTFDDRPALTVPDFTYVRNEVVNHFGINLSSVKASAIRSTDSKYIDFSCVERLVLRISDIEDVLQYNVKII